MPKLLLVGIVEKTCMKTVIREIPGITDCFKNKEDKAGEELYKVNHMIRLVLRPCLTNGSVDHQRFEYPWPVAVRLQRC
jgi:hypothetical protein